MHILIVLVHLISISKACPYLPTAVCSDFVTHCLGYKEGYFESSSEIIYLVS